MASSLFSHYRGWQVVLALLHYAAATLVLVSTEGSGWEVPVVVRYNVWTSNDGQCTGDGGCTINEYERQLGLPLLTGLLVSSFSYISGSHHAFCAIQGQAYIKSLVEHGGVSFVRWLDYSLSASLMLMMDSVLWLAPPTLQQLVLTFVAMFLVIVAGYGSEVAWSHGGRGDADAVRIFTMALMAFTCVWANTWITFGESMHPHSDSYPLKNRSLGPPQPNDPPDFVIVILAWLFITYCSFPMAHFWRIACKENNPGEEGVIAAESVYSFLSFFAKIPLLAVYGTAVSARKDTIAVGTQPPTNTTGPDDGTFEALGWSIGASVVLGIAMAIDLRRLMK